MGKFKIIKIVLSAIAALVTAFKSVVSVIESIGKLIPEPATE